MFDAFQLDLTEPAKKAIDAIVELIVLTLKGEEAGRFAKASSLCTLGQTLLKMQAKSVAEFRELEQGPEGGGIVIGPPGAPMAYANPVRGGVQYPLMNYGNGYNDQAELQRNLMLTVGPVLANYAETQKATAAKDEASELETLIAIRETSSDAHKTVISKRIDTLLKNMETRNGAKSECVADPVVPRGHQAGEPEAERHDAPRLRANGVGGEGYGDAPLQGLVARIV